MFSTPFALSDRRAAESVVMEEPRPVEVLCGEPGPGVRRGEWAAGGDLRNDPGGTAPR
jgi:hypothetical protein